MVKETLNRGMETSSYMKDKRQKENADRKEEGRKKEGGKEGKKKGKRRFIPTRRKKNPNDWGGNDDGSTGDHPKSEKGEAVTHGGRERRRESPLLKVDQEENKDVPGGRNR